MPLYPPVNIPKLTAARNGGAFIIASAGMPSEINDAATFVCDGAADQTDINSYIDQSATNGYGQPVVLVGSNFDISGPIKFRRAVPLAGSRYSTTKIQATGTWTSLDAVTKGAMLEPFDNHQDRCDVRRLMLHGRKSAAVADVGGLYYYVAATTGFLYGADTRSVFEDIYVYEAQRYGFKLGGGEARLSFWSRCVCFACGTLGTTTAHGFDIGGNDSYFDNCDAGDCSGSGFNVTGTNHRVGISKAWFNDLDGFHVETGVRNQFAICESQDNRQHGYYIAVGPNTFTSCHADSNGYNQTTGAVSAFDGFHFPDGFGVSSVQAVGCESYDKNEGARGIRQRYGFFLGNDMTASQVIGVARGNGTDLVGGTGVNGAGMNIQVSGLAADNATRAQVFRAVGSALGSEVTFWRSEQTAAVATQGLDLPQALTELDSGVLGTRKIVEVLDIGSQVQLAVTVRVLQATTDSLTVSVRDTANTANVLATVTISIAAAVATQTAKSTYAAKPAWFTADTTLAVYTSHTGAATLDYIFKDVTLRHRP